MVALLKPDRQLGRPVVGLQLLAALEPLMAALYWPCLSAKSVLEDERANQESGKDGSHDA